MAMSSLQVSSAIDLNIVGEQVVGPVPAKVNKNFQLSVQRTFGTGAGKSNQVCARNRLLAASADEDLDLNGTQLLNPAGVAIELDEVKELIIRNRSAETLTAAVDGVAHTATDATIDVTFPSVNGFLGPFTADAPITLAPGQEIHIRDAEGAGWPVTAATADLINVLNNDGADEAAYLIYAEGGEV